MQGICNDPKDKINLSFIFCVFKLSVAVLMNAQCIRCGMSGLFVLCHLVSLSNRTILWVSNNNTIVPLDLQQHWHQLSRKFQGLNTEQGNPFVFFRSSSPHSFPPISVRPLYSSLQFSLLSTLPLSIVSHGYCYYWFGILCLYSMLPPEKWQEMSVREMWQRLASDQGFVS